MSDDSSDKKPKEWGAVAGVAWGFLAYKAPEMFIGGIAPWLLPLLPHNRNVQSFVLYGTFEVLTIGALYLILRYAYHRSFADIGLNRFKPTYITNAVIGFCTYFVLSIIVSTLAQYFIQVDFNQVQPIGFASPNGFELLLAFVALVIVVPLAEELLFRGFLYKGVRNWFSFPTTVVVVSLLFAIAHGQLNVGLDVFALSLVLCYLREKTGSIWSGVLLHGLKNAVAFFVLFIYNVH